MCSSPVFGVFANATLRSLAATPDCKLASTVVTRLVFVPSRIVSEIPVNTLNLLRVNETVSPVALSSLAVSLSAIKSSSSSVKVTFGISNLECL